MTEHYPPDMAEVLMGAFTAQMRIDNDIHAVATSAQLPPGVLQPARPLCFRLLRPRRLVVAPAGCATSTSSSSPTARAEFPLQSLLMAAMLAENRAKARAQDAFERTALHPQGHKDAVMDGIVVGVSWATGATS